MDPYTLFGLVCLGVIGFFFAVTALICWVNTLTPAFESGLITGFLCFFPPIAFLWGWAKAGKVGLKTNMLVWSAALIPAIVFGVFFGQITGFLGGLVH